VIDWYIYQVYAPRFDQDVHSPYALYSYGVGCNGKTFFSSLLGTPSIPIGIFGDMNVNLFV